MNARGTVHLTVDGSFALGETVRAAQALLGAALPPADGPQGVRVAVVEAAGENIGRRVREQLRDGALAVIALHDPRDVAAVRTLYAAGATAVLAVDATAEEIALAVERALTGALGRQRLATLNRRVVIVNSVARRLLGPQDLPLRLASALEALAHGLGFEWLELRGLPSPIGIDGTSTTVVRCDTSGSRALPPCPLDDLDLTALRERAAVHGTVGSTPVAVLPVGSGGVIYALVRLATGRVALDEDANEILTDAGGLIAAALAAAESAAPSGGTSRELEELIERRARAGEEQRTLFQAVLDALPVSLHAIDRTFRVVVWNRGREDGPLGKPRGEVLGRSLFGVTGDDPVLRAAYEAVFRDGVARVEEVEGRGGNLPRRFRVEKVPMRLGAGSDVTHVITFARDVTSERAMERAMAQTEKLAAVGRLAAGIAHEIKNPLATIAGCAEAMRSRLAEELSAADRQEARGDAEVIEEEAYRCKDILDGLLDFSRVQPDRREACRPEEIAHRTLRLLRNNPRVVGVTLESSAEDGLPEIHADAGQMIQALLALVLNAADAASPGGHVAVRARRAADGSVVLSVEDDGPGIPADIRERIFEPFFTTKPLGQGTGLGLAVVYGLVQAHGGRIDVLSHEDLGTRFDIVLPAMAPAATEVTE